MKLLIIIKFNFFFFSGSNPGYNSKALNLIKRAFKSCRMARFSLKTAWDVRFVAYLRMMHFPDYLIRNPRLSVCCCFWINFKSNHLRKSNHYWLFKAVFHFHFQHIFKIPDINNKQHISHCLFSVPVQKLLWQTVAVYSGKCRTAKTETRRIGNYDLKVFWRVILSLKCALCWLC